MGGLRLFFIIFFALVMNNFPAEAKWKYYCFSSTGRETMARGAGQPRVGLCLASVKNDSCNVSFLPGLHESYRSGGDVEKTFVFFSFSEEGSILGG